MNPTQEQVTSVISEYERQAIIEESRRLEREAEQIWKQYCYEHGILPRQPKPRRLSDGAKFLVAFTGFLLFIGVLVYAAVSQ